MIYDNKEKDMGWGGKGAFFRFGRFQKLQVGRLALVGFAVISPPCHIYHYPSCYVQVDSLPFLLFSLPSIALVGSELPCLVDTKNVICSNSLPSSFH
jgi:hypothetical protein